MASCIPLCEIPNPSGSSIAQPNVPVNRSAITLHGALSCETLRAEDAHSIIKHSGQRALQCLPNRRRCDHVMRTIQHDRALWLTSVQPCRGDAHPVHISEQAHAETHLQYTHAITHNADATMREVFNRNEKTCTSAPLQPNNANAWTLAWRPPCMPTENNRAPQESAGRSAAGTALDRK